MRIPQIVVYTPEELAARTQKTPGPRGRQRDPERIRIIEEYKSILADVEPGYGGDVELAGDD